MAYRILSPLFALALLLSTPSLLTPRGAALAQATPTDTARCPAPVDFSDTGVTVGLEKTFTPGDVVSFGLPVPPGTVKDASTLAVTANGQPVQATVAVLLQNHDADGAPTDVAAVLVQFPASALPETCGSAEVAWQGGGVTVSTEPTPFAETSSASDETVDQATYTIEEQNGQAALVTSDRQQRVFFTSREPAVTATFPSGYLAATGILGDILPASAIGPDLTGLKFISDAVEPFGSSAMFRESYPINVAAVVDPTDPDAYEGWLYDRCATFLVFYVHTGDTKFLREGYRLCSYYADHIELNGENRGIFTGKPEPDPKYSHLRGLVAYYALTGDEVAKTAGTAMADLFLADQTFAGQYRAGHIQALDHIWTERLLGVSIEAFIFGHRLTGDVAYLNAAKEMVGTAHRHITGDAATLAQINPGAPAFPPQNCFIHTAGQAAEGDPEDPWCSGWMPALMIGGLLAYQEQTGDPKVDEIFVRLTRYLRDVGSAYFVNTNANENDTFLNPSVASRSPDDEDQRLLVPLYGAGLDVNGNRQNYGEYDDFQHCLDATAITAVGLRALKNLGGFDQNPIGPFATEGESFVALHEQFAYCAQWTFGNETRLNRDPANWTSDELAEGLADPAAFIADNRIGDISHNDDPARKISWWFNESLEQFGILQEIGVAIPKLRGDLIQPGDVAPQPMPTVAPAAVATAPPAPTSSAEPTAESDTSAPTSEPAAETTPTPAVTEGGAAADGEGQIVYAAADGTISRVAARAGATPENLTEALDAVAPASSPDLWGGISPDGQWLLLTTARFFDDCSGWACLVVLHADLSAPEAVTIGGQVVHPSVGAAAIASGGDLVVYTNTGGPHDYDLWATKREGDGWSDPILLSGDSPYPFHFEPTISADGSHVLFDCGTTQYVVSDTAICEVAIDGSGFRVVLGPGDGPAGSSPTAALRHPVYAPDGSIVFSADWYVPAVWRLPPGADAPEQVAPAFGVDHTPCVLPDGRIASLWQSRPENSAGLREIKVMTADGTSYVTLATGADVSDITCGGG